MPRRVLIFSLAYPPFVGGAELAVKEITDRITDTSFTLVTVNLDGKQPAKERLGNVEVHRLGHGWLDKYRYPWTAARYASHLHSEQPFDAVWGIMANQAGLAALYFKKQHPTVGYLLTLQEGDSLRSIWIRTWWMRRSYKDIYRKADAIHAISQFLADRAAKYGYGGRLEIIPNGVNREHFSRPVSAEALSALREKLGITAGERVVVTASRLVKKNGLDLLIRAMQGTSARLLIVGAGRLDSRLRSLALDLGVHHKVIFAGQKDHAELPAYLQLADVFVRPSRSEGLGSAFIEAMAAGLPVIATRVGGIPDFLRNGQNGLFCQLGNPRDLAQKISWILRDDALRARLSAGASQTAREYEWDALAARMASSIAFVTRHGDGKPQSLA